MKVKNGPRRNRIFLAYVGLRSVGMLTKSIVEEAVN
jgi:hypothetical protein